MPEISRKVEGRAVHVLRRFPMRLRMHLNPWTVATGLLVALILAPIAYVLLFGAAAFGEPESVPFSAMLGQYIAHTLLLMLAVGVASAVLGVSCAWLIAACDFPGRRLFEWALILPLAVPTYIAAYTYAGLFDYFGPLQNFLRRVFTPDSGSAVVFDVMTFESLAVIMAFVLYPYVYLIVRASFTRQSASMLESAYLLGKSPWVAFRRVALPMARPALAAGLSLVLMEVLNDYGAVQYFGITTFTTGIFRSWFSLGDSEAALRLAALLMLFVFILLLSERSLRGKARFDSGAATYRPLRRFRLRGYKAAAAVLVCLLPLAGGFIIPGAQLGVWAIENVEELFDGAAPGLVLNSFVLAVAAALACVAVAVVIVYTLRLYRNRFSAALARAALLGYSIPGAVIAVGVMTPLAALDNTVDALAREYWGFSTGLLLSGTLFALLFAYVVRFLAVGQSTVDSGFERTCANMEEAARSLGVAPLKTLWRVNIPLARSALFSALILVFVDVLKELPLTLILRPFNFDTLATRTFELAGDERVAQSAPFALIIILAGVVPIIALNRLMEHGRQ